MATWLVQAVFLFLGAEILLSGGTCPDGWVTFEGSCYWFADGIKKDWTEATHYCSSHAGSNLVVIDSAPEEFMLRSYALRLFKDHSNGLTSFWIGATDDEIEGLWVWYTNHELISNGYTNWAPGQPTNFDIHDQDCGCLWGPSGYLWEDCSCSDQLHAICEKNITAGNVLQIITG